MNNVSTAFDFIFIKKNYFQREILLLKISVILCRKQKAVGRILQPDWPWPSRPVRATALGITRPLKATLFEFNRSPLLFFKTKK